MKDKNILYFPTQKITVCADAHGQRIDNFLLNVLKGVPKSHIYKILRKGEVRVNGGRKKPIYRLVEGDLVRVPPVRVGLQPELDIPKKVYDNLHDHILYENDDLLVISKPSGLPVHAGSNFPYGVIEVMQRHHGKSDRIELAHRIDRGTSGCLLLAKNREVLNVLQNAFRHGRMQKSYLAFLSKSLSNNETVVDKPLLKKETAQGDRVVVDKQGKSAYSKFYRYQIPGVDSRVDGLYRVVIKTGRTHQIRVHAQSLGAPLAGDAKYGDYDFNRKCKSLGLNRIFLHAHELSFEVKGERIQVTAPLPDDLTQFLEKYV